MAFDGFFSDDFCDGSVRALVILVEIMLRLVAPQAHGWMNATDLYWGLIQEDGASLCCDDRECSVVWHNHDSLFRSTQKYSVQYHAMSRSRHIPSGESLS